MDPKPYSPPQKRPMEIPLQSMQSYLVIHCRADSSRKQQTIWLPQQQNLRRLFSKVMFCSFSHPKKTVPTKHWKQHRQRISYVSKQPIHKNILYSHTKYKRRSEWEIGRLFNTAMMEELICWNFLHYTMLPIICRKYYVLGRNAIIINIITPQHILDITIYFAPHHFLSRFLWLPLLKKQGTWTLKKTLIIYKKQSCSFPLLKRAVKAVDHAERIGVIHLFYAVQV